MNFQLDKFSPQKSELQNLAIQYSALTINGVTDKDGYKAVDEARKDLKRKRVEITKTGKELREEAVAFQKKVIAVEKDLVALIEPIEIELKEKQEVIDKAIETEKRRVLLPARKEQLKEIEVELADEFLLTMNDQEFLAYFNNKKAEVLAERERKIKEEKEALEKQQRALEEAKKIEEAKVKAAEAERQKAEENARAAAIQAEIDKKAAVEAERKRAEEEKALLIAEQEKKEKERLEAIEAEQKKLAAEKLRLEAHQKYQDWLAANNYNDQDFLIQRDGETFFLYKKISKFISNQ